MDKFPEWDPSMPNFHYTEAERAEFVKHGMSESEIEEKEALARAKLVEKKLEDEMRKAA